jgi:hypothetical protein
MSSVVKIGSAQGMSKMRLAGVQNGDGQWKIENGKLKMRKQNRDKLNDSPKCRSGCPKWLFGRVMLCHNRDRKKVATERNPPDGSKHPMQDGCPE